MTTNDIRPQTDLIAVWGIAENELNADENR